MEVGGSRVKSRVYSGECDRRWQMVGETFFTTESSRVRLGVKFKNIETLMIMRRIQINVNFYLCLT